jgi:hypothetical protein
VAVEVEVEVEVEVGRGTMVITYSKILRIFY